jgi:hypothetical protein
MQQGCMVLSFNCNKIKALTIWIAFVPQKALGTKFANDLKP